MNKKLISIIVVAFLCAGAFYYLQSNKQEFNLTTEQKAELLEEIVPESDVADWAYSIAPDIMTFGYNDHAEKLGKHQKNFTPNGWKGFTDALAAARIIDSIEENLQIITAKSAGEARIISKQVVDGERFEWAVQLPIDLEYDGEDGVRQDKWLVTLVIVRVPESHNSKEIAIAQWIATPNS